MSGRDHHMQKGSSRTRTDHDSRPPRELKEKSSREKRDRSRSRSPQRPGRSHGRNDRYDATARNKSRTPSPPPLPKNYSRDLVSLVADKNVKEQSMSPSSEPEDEVPAPPPPPRITKITMGFSKPAAMAPIKMSLGAPSAKAVTVAAPKPGVAAAFNDSDDEEPEEMPAEARMRMRNIGRETPTSAGPNSFGKTKQGFCDAKKVFERNMKQALETPQSKAAQKLPQTIYKLKGS